MYQQYASLTAVNNLSNAMHKTIHNIVVDNQRVRIEIDEAYVRLDEENNRMAWIEEIEYPFGCEYRIKAKHNGVEIVDWKVDDGDLLVGCLIWKIQWYENSLVVVLRLRGGNFIYRFDLKGKMIPVALGPRLSIKGNVVAYTDEEDWVRLIRLPDLKELRSMSRKKAVKSGWLPDEYCTIND